MKKFWKKYKHWIIGVWGVGTTVLSLYWAIYPLEQNAHLTFYQESKVDFSTVDQPINELQIIINGQNIREQDLNLKVYKFRLTNDGKRDIKESDYAKDIIFGFHTNGKIARVNLSKTSSFSRRLLNGLSKDSSTAIFNPVFFEKERSIVFDVWVLHKKKVDPIIVPIGKIADTKIEFTDKSDGELSGWEKFTKIYELLFFALIQVGAIALGLIILQYIYKFIRDTSKRHTIKSIYDIEFDPSNRAQRGLIKLYVSNKKLKFLAMLKLFTDPEKVNAVFSEARSIDKEIDAILEKYTTENFELEYDYISQDLEAIEHLIEMGFATETSGGTVQIDNDFVKQANLTLSLFEKPSNNTEMNK